MIKISVILCTFNRSSLLKEAIRSLVSQEIPATSTLEVIVVDNNSTDDTRVVVGGFIDEFPGLIRYVFEPTQGRSGAVNTGILESKGDVVAFIHDDAIAEVGWLVAIIAAFEKNECDAVGGPVYPLWEEQRPSWLVEELYCKIGLADYGREKRWLDEDHQPIGCNLAVQKGVFERIGVYNTKLGRKGDALFAGDDDEFLTRLLKVGGHILYEPDAITYHRIPVLRMQKKYFRRVEMFSGLSNARVGYPGIPSLFNVPRFYYRRAFNKITRYVWYLLSGRWNEAFCQELYIWYLAGYLRGSWERK